MDEVLLKRIANHQLLHGSFCKDLGILNGKMGVVLFFFHYARHTGNTLYSDFAGELLDEVIQELHNELPIRFSDGLCGIGWGIEYLIRNAFVTGDSDEILEEFDCKIMERNPRRMTDFSFKTGLEGIACYVSFRIASNSQHKMPFDSLYLDELNKVLLEQNVMMKFKTDRILKYMIIDSGNIKGELSWKYGLNMLAL